MHNLKIFLPFVLLASVFVACNKDIFTSSSPSVNATFAGRVVDEGGQAVSGAQVRMEGELAITDDNGVFRLKAMSVPADDAKLMVTKIGYFEFSRAYYVEGDALQTISIQLLHKDQIGTVNAGSGGTIQLPGGATLVFPADGFIDEHSNSYAGTVLIYARQIDPSLPDFSLKMPGDLRAINQAGEQQTLGIFGMVGVELKSQTGEDLRIRQGNEVEIHLPIASSQIVLAPAQITLWHYDIQLARWIEEGSAQRIRNEYVGRVKHFSFWSFSTAFNVVDLKGKVFLADDLHPLSGAVVRLTMISDSTKGFASTNANGVYKGGVPIGETFIMDVLNACGEVIFTQNVGPYTTSTNAPDIIVPNNGTHTVEITGRILDCTGGAVKNGYAQVLLGNYKWVGFTGSDGTFRISQLRCDTSVGTGVVIGFDMQNQKQSPPDTISVPPNAVTLGDLSACDLLNEYIRFSLDNNDYTIAVPVGGVLDNSGMHTFLNGYSTALQDVGISMEFASDGQPGLFSLANLYVNTLTWNSAVSGVNIEVVDPGYVVGDLITGMFEGAFVDQFGVPHTLSGTYQVRRDY